MKCDKVNSDPTFNAATYKPPERYDELLHIQINANELDETSKTHWSEELSLRENYSACRDKFIIMLTQSEACGTET